MTVVTIIALASVVATLFTFMATAVARLASAAGAAARLAPGAEERLDELRAAAHPALQARLDALALRELVRDPPALTALQRQELARLRECSFTWEELIAFAPSWGLDPRAVAAEQARLAAALAAAELPAPPLPPLPVNEDGLPPDPGGRELGDDRHWGYDDEDEED